MRDLVKILIIHLSKKASPKIHVLKRVSPCDYNHTVFGLVLKVTSRSGVIKKPSMVSDVCVPVKSSSVFPHLLPCEFQCFAPRSGASD